MSAADDGNEDKGAGEPEEESVGTRTAVAVHGIHDGQPRVMMLIVPEEVVASGGVEFVQLPHPRTGAETLYGLLTHKDATVELLELQRARPKRGSWLVGERVVEDGSVVLATPVDATFLALRPLTEAAKTGSFCALDDAVTRGVPGAAAAAGMRRLLRVASLQRGLRRICETRPVAGAEYVRLAAEKTVVSWLRERVEAVATVVTTGGGLRLRYLGAAGSFSAAFKRPEDIDVTPEAATRAALGFLSECVPPEWLQRVAESYEFKDFVVPKAPKLCAPADAGYKRSRPEFVAASSLVAPPTAVSSPSTSPYAKKPKKADLAAAAAAAAAAAVAVAKKKRAMEAAKGSKLITSFFHFSPPPSQPPPPQQPPP